MASTWALVTRSKPTHLMKILSTASATAKVVAVFLFMLMAPFAQAKQDDPSAIGVYLAHDAFVAQAFPNVTPEKKTLWIRGDLKKAAAAIMAHRYSHLRAKYWQAGDRTAWILNEIGKEKPITMGVVVDSGKVESMHVLTYRESRGWEVRYPFFLEQFQSASLTDNNKLDRAIDGISGATLSVRALTKLARLALYFHRHVSAK